MFFLSIDCDVLTVSNCFFDSVTVVKTQYTVFLLRYTVKKNTVDVATFGRRPDEYCVHGTKYTVFCYTVHIARVHSIRPTLCFFFSLSNFICTVFFLLLCRCDNVL